MYKYYVEEIENDILIFIWPIPCLFNFVQWHQRIIIIIARMVLLRLHVIKVQLKSCCDMYTVVCVALCIMPHSTIHSNVVIFAYLEE